MFLKFETVTLRIFYLLHWGVPWLILILGVYTIVSFVRGYIDKRAFTNVEDRLFVIFRNLMKIQGMTGLVYFVWISLVTHRLLVYHIAHAITMLVAAMILPFASRWKNEDDATRYLNHFYLLLASFLIMLVGLALIPNTADR